MCSPCGISSGDCCGLRGKHSAGLLQAWKLPELPGGRIAFGAEELVFLPLFPGLEVDARGGGSECECLCVSACVRSAQGKATGPILLPESSLFLLS